MAKRKARGGRKSTRRRTSTAKRTRRNPPARRARRRFSFGRSSSAIALTPKSIIATGVQAVKDAGGMLTGEGIAGLAESRIPGVTPGTTKSAVAAVVVTVVAAAAASRVVGRRFAESMAAGAVAKVARRAIKNADVPVLSGALGDYGLPLVRGEGVGAWAPALPSGAPGSAFGAEDYAESMYGY